jgi:hypothetical protein
MAQENSDQQDVQFIFVQRLPYTMEQFPQNRRIFFRQAVPVDTFPGLVQIPAPGAEQKERYLQPCQRIHGKMILISP